MKGAGVSYQIEYLFRPRGRGEGDIELAGRCGPLACRARRSAAACLRHRAPDQGPASPRPAYARSRQLRSAHRHDEPRPHGRGAGRDDGTAAQRDGKSCAFLVATIANLAVVNDAYGYDIADEVIIAVGRRLRQVVRTGDAIGRYSGAKFGIILANCEDRDLEIAAERFLSVARESVIDTVRGPVWAMLSIGGLVLPKYAETPGLAMARAEEALAEARRLPTDGFIAFRPSAERVSVRGHQCPLRG